MVLAGLQSLANRLFAWLYQRGLPWIFVLASETLVPLLVVVAVAALLVNVPQANEILFGMVQDYDTQSLPYWAMIATSILLSLTVAFCSRLLVTIDANRTRPRAFLNSRAQRTLLIATREAPRLLGAICSAVIFGAFLYAFREDGSDTSLGPKILAVLTPFPALCLIYWFHLNYQPSPSDEPQLVPKGAPTVSLVTLAVTLALVLALQPTSYWAALATICLPATTYFFLVRRRAIVNGVLEWGNSKKLLQEATTIRQFDDSIKWLLFYAACGLVPLVLLAVGSAGWLVAIGSVGVVFLFMSGLLAFVTAILLLLRRVSLGVPGFTLTTAAFVWLLIAIASALAGHLLMAERIDHDAAALSPMPGRLSSVANSDPNNAKDCKMAVVVNAHGGGIRAALFTAQLLASLDDRTNGKFGECLTSLSGVSGGSFGIAVYLTLRAEYKKHHGWESADRTKYDGLRSWIDEVLSKDHLSPVLGRLLAVDIIPFGGDAQRGQALLDSVNIAILSTLSNRGIKDAKGLNIALEDLDGGSAGHPVIFFNASDVGTGRRAWFSNSGYWCLTGEGKSKRLDGRLSAGRAMLNSARFPIVSPAGVFDDEGHALMLVDGGYAENSGAATLNDYLSNPNPQNLCEKHIDGPINGTYVWMDIDGNPAGVPPGVSDDSCGGAPEKPLDTGMKKTRGNTPSMPSEITRPSQWTAITTLFNVRSSQEAIAVQRLKDKNMHSCAYNLGRRELLPNGSESRTAPLGWYLNRATVDSMRIGPLSKAVSKACTYEIAKLGIDGCVASQ